MLRTPHLPRRIAEGKPLFCFKANVPHAMMPELLGSCGVQALWLDTEHFPTSLETMAEQIRSCRASDVDAVVRTPNRAFADAWRMLDAGADAIMYPRATSAAEIEELVRWTKYPPVGRRGLDVGVAAAGYSALSIDGMLERGGLTSLLVQIETREALEDLDAIAAVPGVDLLFLGPGDLSVELELHTVDAATRDRTLEDAIERVASTAKRHGVAWGMPASNVAHAHALAQRGATLIPIGSDTSLLRREVTALFKALTEG